MTKEPEKKIKDVAESTLYPLMTVSLVCDLISLVVEPLERERDELEAKLKQTNKELETLQTKLELYEQCGL